MPPAIIAAGVVGAATIGGAAIASSGQKSAANTAAAAQQQATSQELQLGQQNIAFQRDIYNQNKALLTPFVDRGNVAGNQINALLGLGGNAAPAQAPAPTAAQPTSAGQGYQTASPYTQQPYLPPQYTGTGGIGGDSAGAFQLKPTFADLQANDYVAHNGMGAFDQASNTFYPNAPANYFDQGGSQSAPVAAQTPVGAQTAAPAGQTSQQSAQSAFDQFAHSAGIDFQLKQGTNALQNSAAARGLLQSGATLKALQGYGQKTAIDNYFLPYMGLLQGQQATGAQSGAAIAGVGSNFGNTVSSIYGGQQNAIGNGADALSNAALLKGQANANFGNTVGSALGTFGSSFFAPSSTPAAAAGGYAVNSGTSNYFAKNPFGGSY